MLPLLFAFSVCSFGDTPEKTFEELKKAMAEKDWNAFYELLVPSEREEMNKQLDLMRKSPQGLAQLAKMTGQDAEKLKKLSAKKAALLLLDKMAEREKETFEKEIGKIRNGTITSKGVDGDTCVIKYKAGEEEGKIDLIRVEGSWYYSMMTGSKKASNERNASTSLKTLATAQADFRANDRDGDEIANFWVKDVAGLYGIQTKGEKIALIMVEIARADRTEGKGKYPSVKEGFAKAGYCFVALKKYKLSGESHPYDDGSGKNISRFGFAAYPDKYGTTARKTYIINEANVVYWKDTRGQVPNTFPEHPEEEGWSVIE